MNPFTDITTPLDADGLTRKAAEAERLTFLNYTPELYEGPRLDHQPVMSRLARRHVVLYVRPDGTMDQLRAALGGAGRLRSQLRELAPGIHELTPSLFLPRVFASEVVDDALARLRTGSVLRAAERLNPGGRKILYYWNPAYGRLVGRMKEELSVFHMHDYYPGFAEKGSREYLRIRDSFRRAMETTDLVIACSQALLHEAHALGRRDAKLVENGVDFEVVARGASMAVPTELASLPRPIVAHIGRINRKLDMEALERMARARPNWSWVLMGPRTGWPEAYERQFQKLLSRQNVHFIPGRGWDELPAYFNAIDVGLMAYRTEGTWMSYGFPLKVWEYFSLGKPVVGADVLSLRQLSGLLRLVPSGGDWVEAVESALTENSASLREQRISMARRFSWDSRAATIESLIHDALVFRSVP